MRPANISNATDSNNLTNSQQKMDAKPNTACVPYGKPRSIHVVMR